MAQSGHLAAEFQCPLLGVKRTSYGRAPMSAFDPKRTLAASSPTPFQRARLPVRCLVLSFGGGNEATRVHFVDRRRRGGVAARGARATTREDAAHRYTYVSF